MEQDPQREETGRPTSSEEVAAMRLRAGLPNVMQVAHLEAPPRFVRPPRIHPRRVLPFIKEGPEREFHSTTRQILFHRPQALAAPMMAATADLTLVTNTELTSPGQQQTASNVGEPSMAVNDQVVFYTGNWYAAMSSDGGKTFRYIDPATAFQASDPPNSHFCCDQVVNYL